jgi:leucyl-tRNA synthetase
MKPAISTKTSTKNLIENSREPFQSVYNQGMILGKDSQKMSKSRGNVTNPDDVVREYGADCLRMYEMFMGPFSESKPWNTDSIKGVFRFLGSVWVLIEKIEQQSSTQHSRKTESSELDLATNKLIVTISEKIPKLQFNTCISDFMIYLNKFGDVVDRERLIIFLKLLFPFAPIISAEGLERLGQSSFLEDYYSQKSVWPEAKLETKTDTKVTIKIMIANKFRGEISTDLDTTQDEVISKIKSLESVSRYLPEEIQKIIYIPGKVINII